MKRRTGLTLIELAVAVVIVGVVASVAVPAAMNRRILANEASAVAALRDIATAQERFRAARYVDVNDNGVGEYGLLRELSGLVGVRTNSTAATVGSTLDSPLLPREFRRFNRIDEARRAGYLFTMFLPGVAGTGIPEMSIGALASSLESDLAETTWCCYARPQRRGVTGGRTFFTNQTGDIVSADTGNWGTYGFVASNAGSAFQYGGALTGITGAVAVGTVGRDGNLWRSVATVAVERTLVARGTVFGSYGNYGGRSASIEIVSHEDLSGTRETIVVRAFGLQPGRYYGAWITGLTPFSPGIGFGARADSDGITVLRFDSRRRGYPAGISSLTELAGGEIWIGHGDTTDFNGRVPGFEAVARDATSIAKKIVDDEASTIAALHEIAVAQMKFQEMKAVDVNGDGVGEFGLLRELSGLVGVRTTGTAATVGNVLSPPVLSSEYGIFNANSEALRSGYVFRMFLPAWSSGAGVPEISTGQLGWNVASDLAATTWCCYASPLRRGKSGARTFFVNQTGDVVATDARYSRTGAFTASNAGAAFQSGGPMMTITGTVATGTVGRDGNVWRAVPSRTDDHDFVVRGALTPTTSGAAAGTFVVESRQLANATDESIAVDASGLDGSTAYRVVLIDASQAASVFGTATSDARGGVAFRFDGRFQSLPDGVASVTDFGGGTIELRDGDTPVLSGAIPVFATVLGPTIADSSAVFHVKRPLDQLPKSLPRSGSFDVRVTNAEGGRREELVVEIATFDRGATYDVVAVDAQDVATPLGAIRVAGLRGTGALTVDTKRGDAVPGAIVALSGARIEVRASTGAVVLAGTMPVVK